MNKKLNRVSFAETLKSLRPLKTLFSNDRLPYEFDLNWDIKTPRQLLSHCIYFNTDVFNQLARYGYDAKKITNWIRKNKESLKKDIDSGEFYSKIYDI